MADPHIQSPMDGWDFLTVLCYRSGLTLAAIATLGLPYLPEYAEKGLLVAGVLSASSLHLYLKTYRYLFQFAVWIGLLCQIFGLPSLALGAMFFTLGGLCYKEYFCFRVIGLNFQPLLLALLWFCRLLPISNLNTPLVMLLSALSGVLFLLLSIQKWRMPLHFDIGDKGKYQI